MQQTATAPAAQTADAELAAAIARGIADGSIIELTPEVLDAMRFAEGLPPRADVEPALAAAAVRRRATAGPWIEVTR